MSACACFLTSARPTMQCKKKERERQSWKDTERKRKGDREKEREKETNRDRGRETDRGRENRQSKHDQTCLFLVFSFPLLFLLWLSLSFSLWSSFSFLCLLRHISILLHIFKNTIFHTHSLARALSLSLMFTMSSLLPFRSPPHGLPCSGLTHHLQGDGRGRAYALVCDKCL